MFDKPVRRSLAAIATVVLLLAACSSNPPDADGRAETNAGANSTDNAVDTGGDVVADDGGGIGDLPDGRYRVTSPTLRLQGGIDMICAHFPNDEMLRVTFYSTEQSATFGSPLVDFRVIASYDGIQGDIAREGMFFTVFEGDGSEPPLQVTPVITDGSVTGQGADVIVTVTGTFDPDATFEFSGTCEPNVFDS